MADRVSITRRAVLSGSAALLAAGSASSAAAGPTDIGRHWAAYGALCAERSAALAACHQAEARALALRPPRPDLAVFDGDLAESLQGAGMIVFGFRRGEVLDSTQWARLLDWSHPGTPAHLRIMAGHKAAGAHEVACLGIDRATGWTDAEDFLDEADAGMDGLEAALLRARPVCLGDLVVQARMAYRALDRGMAGDEVATALADAVLALAGEAR